MPGALIAHTVVARISVFLCVYLQPWSSLAVPQVAEKSCVEVLEFPQMTGCAGFVLDGAVLPDCADLGAGPPVPVAIWAR